MTCLPTANQAEAIIELWSSKRFNTYDIHRFVAVPEHVVARTIQAARDIARMAQERAET